MPHKGTWLEDISKKDIKRFDISRCLMCSEAGDLEVEGEADWSDDGRFLEMWCKCPICGTIYLYKFKIEGIERHSVL